MNSLLTTFVDLFLHLDSHLATVVGQYGMLTYGLLFLIIFCETGLVVMPFLPGDSLLFATGAIAALGSLNIWLLFIILSIAAILGDTVNYWIGHFLGQRLIEEDWSFIKKEHIAKTQAFYEKHGGKTIILARFVPIIRTFAPFVAGVGKMHYGQFISYNIIGGTLWVAVALFAGFFFGNIPVVKHNFSLVIIGVVVVSLVPILIEYLRNRRESVPSISGRESGTQ